MFWTIEDLNNGLCTVGDLGNPKPEPVAPEPPPALDLDKVPPSLRKRLQNDALQAYHELGGVEYLKKNPDLLDKILAKTIAPEAMPAVQNNTLIQEWPAWLTARRLAYQESAEVAEDVLIKAVPPPAG